MFWLRKGIEWTKSKEVESAIDYYKQSLRLNPDNFEAAFNLAWEYEVIDSLSIAGEWFKYWWEINPQSSHSFWGVALWCYKKADFEESNKYIDLAIKSELKNNKNAIQGSHIDKPLLWMMRWLINIKLCQYEKVQEDYLMLSPFIRVKEGQQLCKYIFGLILLPVEQNRKMVIDSIEGLNDIWNFYEKPAPEVLFLRKFYDYDSGWES